MTLTRENILKYIAELGKGLVNKSCPSYHTYDRERRAALYADLAETLRGVYRDVRGCKEDRISEALSRGVKAMGCESNVLRLLLLGWQGKLGKTGWTVVNGDLVFVH